MRGVGSNLRSYVIGVCNMAESVVVNGSLRVSVPRRVGVYGTEGKWECRKSARGRLRPKSIQTKAMEEAHSAGSYARFSLSRHARKETERGITRCARTRDVAGEERS